MTQWTTKRLKLRRLCLQDASFIFELVNEPGWLEFIGDKGVKDLDDARNYLEQGPLTSYREYGFGLNLVQLKDHTPIGICGLLQREFLNDPDLGFAILSRHWGQGYAIEAARVMIDYATQHLGFKRITAITLPHNTASINVLSKLGMQHQTDLAWPGEKTPSHLYQLLHEPQD